MIESRAVIPWTTREPLLALGELVDRLERGWYGAEFWDDPREHIYAPWPIKEFVTALSTVREATENVAYLEVGCGIGSKLVLAAFMGFDVTGIEKRERYVAVARHLCPEARVEVAEARGYGYRAFDVIYCYRPFVDDDLEAALEAEITAGSRPGTILILPDRDPGPSWQRLAPNVWRRL